MASSPKDALASMIANLKEKTGRNLEQWVALVKKSGLAKHGEVVALLKSGHDMGHGYANLVAQTALKAEDEPEGDELVASQYAGDKAALRPIYDALARAVAAFGKDVAFAPKKTYVSLRRAKQFGILQPSAKTRFDVGLNLKGVEPSGRLEASGSFNSMCTHRVRLEKAADVDAALIAWLKRAYDGAG